MDTTSGAVAWREALRRARIAAIARQPIAAEPVNRREYQVLAALDEIRERGIPFHLVTQEPRRVVKSETGARMLVRAVFYQAPDPVIAHWRNVSRGGRSNTRPSLMRNRLVTLDNMARKDHAVLAPLPPPAARVTR